MSGSGGGLAVLVLVVFLLIAGTGGKGSSSRGRSTGGRTVTIHGHAHGAAGPGLRRFIARHEGGHMVGAEAAGGRVESAEVYADGSGGLVRARFDEDDPRKVIAFLLAGQRAVGSSRGASADDAAVRTELRRVPRGERRALYRAADGDARRYVRQGRSKVNRYARTLDRNGRA